MNSEALRVYTVRGEDSAGTTSFWRIAALYVLWRGVRVTLALTYVLPKESRLTIWQRLLNLDKGFYQGDLIRYLQDVNLSAVIACPIRGKPG